jgi:hypothetical protein
VSISVLVGGLGTGIWSVRKPRAPPSTVPIPHDAADELHLDDFLFDLQLPYWTHAVGIHAYWPVRVQLYEYSTWTYRSVCSTVQHCTAVLYSCRKKLAGIQRSLGNPRISRNRRNLQNRNSAATEIAIRFGPKILLKCDRRETGPKYPTIGLDYGYKSSFSLNHRFNHYDRRTWDFQQPKFQNRRADRDGC